MGRAAGLADAASAGVAVAEGGEAMGATRGSTGGDLGGVESGDGRGVTGADEPTRKSESFARVTATYQRFASSVLRRGR